jgi:DNA-binding LacI/PurR family transcriptional regulator
VAQRTTGTKKHAIEEDLIERITSGELEVGSELPSIRALAERYDSSIAPVYQAFQSLEKHGYVRKKHGSGTYVADTTRAFELSRSVGLGLNLADHLWARLDRMLAGRLLMRRLLPIVFSPRGSHGREELMSLARSDVPAFVFRGHGGGLPQLNSPIFNDKVVVTVVSSSGIDAPHLCRVVSDSAAGGRLVARYFHERGHHRALLTGPRFPLLNPVQMKELDRPDFGHRMSDRDLAFVREWERLGGRWTTLSFEGWKGSLPAIDPADLLAELDSSNEPATAVFGIMDVVAHTCQRIVREHRPELMDTVDFVGYMNTPWSESGDPPFTSVSLELETIAERTCAVLTRSLEGESGNGTVEVVRPRLVERGT